MRQYRTSSKGPHCAFLPLGGRCPPSYYNDFPKRHNCTQRYGRESIDDNIATLQALGEAADAPQYDAEMLGEAFTSGANEHMVEQIGSRLTKLKTLESRLGVNAYPEVSADAVTDMDNIALIISNHRDLKNNEELESVSYHIYGRIKAMRFDGMFVVIEDVKGNELQVMFRRKQTIEVANKTYDSERIGHILDIGDIIDVRGHIKRTSTGELTLVGRSVAMLAKCLLPMPDGFHGLKDITTRQRLRHVDIMTNRDSKNLLLQRSHIIWHLRKFLHDRGFVEVETPILQHLYSGAHATPFKTHSEALGDDLYLRIAPEFYLKRLIAGGFADKIFEIGKCFRNEGTSTRHSPEFTMIELYQQLSNAEDMMRLMEDIVVTLSEGLGTSIPKFTRRTMNELIREHTGIDVEGCSSEDLLSILNDRGVDTTPLSAMTRGNLVCALFKDAVEDHITEPTHVTDFPADSSPLAAAVGSHGRVFESYIAGLEVAHGCTEECNPVELLRKLDGCGLEGLGHARDTEFLNAVAYGLTPTAGLGIGIDRLVMALTGASSIKNTQTFPLLKTVE
ncbi:Lysine--tRNA ligase [Babesia sp. Xinjiang]|uniref:Lysine--tRNA ligase n=1 Tax=Babesia sp. Xinjiang TaxID=462227 RepID=UPI000A24E59E|nr:Lysine--tRNA ligase [Babesia sp. Xinjiang]ORM41510.1 Lysine--tRNA ligase [Babesia sp. Xinjiang]